MSGLDITGRRLRARRVSAARVRKPEDVVRWMGAGQAQEYAETQVGTGAADAACERRVD